MSLHTAFCLQGLEPHVYNVHSHSAAFPSQFDLRVVLCRNGERVRLTETETGERLREIRILKRDGSSSGTHLQPLMVWTFWINGCYLTIIPEFWSE